MGDLEGDPIPPICEEKWHLLGVTIPWMVCFGVFFEWGVGFADWSVLRRLCLSLVVVEVDV